MLTTPGSTEALRTLLHEASARGENVRALRAGHSFTGDRDARHRHPAHGAGRPGAKLRTLDRDALTAPYPRLDGFFAVRDTYDPDRLFPDAYTTLLFG